MKPFFTFFTLLLLLAQTAVSQTLVNVEFLGNVSKASLQQQFFQPFNNGADRYRVTYQTTGIDGNTTTASGLVCLPDDATTRYPLACYQHGTSSVDTDVPSNLGFDATIAVALCGKGYVSFAPDYLGLGVSEGIHPYVHAASQAWVAVDLLYASTELAGQEGIAVSDQVFITGYSQGGHAAMAFHQMMEEELQDEFTVAASVPMSGPYSIGEVMRDLILSGEEYSRPGYLINTIVSYQFVYGDLFSTFEEAFKTEYVSVVEQFYNEEISLGEVDAALVDLLTANEGAVIPVKVLNDDYVAAIESNPNHPANLRMIENNTYDWAPGAPTRLFYCTADEQVPFENSILAASTMQANGAADVQAVDINPAADHASCAFFATLNMINFFAQYQVLEPLTAVTAVPGRTSLAVFPNPASDLVVLKNLPSEGTLRIFDWQGRAVLHADVNRGDHEVSLDGLGNGIYLIEFAGQRQKLVVQK